MKKFWKRFFIVVVCLLFLCWLISLRGPRSRYIEYGVTFSYPYAESLGLDWKQAYQAMLNDLHPKYLRLSAYWDATEPNKDQYDFSALDYQIDQASSHNVKIV